MDGMFQIHVDDDYRASVWCGQKFKMQVQYLVKRRQYNRCVNQHFIINAKSQAIVSQTVFVVME